jgi:hypothetical protein
VPIIRGQLYSFLISPAQNKKAGFVKGTPKLKYVVLDPTRGDIVLYKTEQDFLNQTNLNNTDFVKLSSVMCAWGPSGRLEMKKNGVDRSIELNF